MNTGQKTNLVGYFSLGIVLVSLAAIFFDKITGAEFISILGAIGAFAGVMVALLTKAHSYEKQNTTGGNANPRHEQH